MFQMVRILILGVTRSNIYHLLCIVLDISVQQLIWQSLWWQVLHSPYSFVKQSSRRQLSFPWLLSGLGSWPNIQCIYCHFQQSTYYYCTERVPQRKLKNPSKFLSWYNVTVDAILIPTIGFLRYVPGQWSLITQEVHISCGLHNCQVPQLT